PGRRGRAGQGGRRPGGMRVGGRGPQPAPAHARRGLPHPHRQAHGRRGRDPPGGLPMTATTTADLAKDPAPLGPAADETLARPSRGLLHDTWVLARRGLIHMKRQPEQLSDATIQPIMFVVLFAFVFGGSIRIPGFPDEPRVYREFLLAGIMAQTLVFTAFGA